MLEAGFCVKKTLGMEADGHERTLIMGYHLTRIPRYILTGCWGECIAQQGQPLYAYGTLFVIAEYALFVFLSLNGGFRAPRNISICGYMELLPDWVAFMYCHVVGSSTRWFYSLPPL